MRLRQEVFGFRERSRRHQRLFKLGIVLATSAAVAVIMWIMLKDAYRPSLRAAIARATNGIVPLPAAPRAGMDDSRRAFRLRGIEVTRARVEQLYAHARPAMQRLLEYAAMDPEHGLLRWGNVDWTILLSAKVFEADDTGRSFRLRPRTRSIWLHGPPLETNVPLYLLVPDGPGLTDVIQGMGLRSIESSRQTTNSWGLRSPEPELDAPVRVLVLGDSFMQGLFISDDETPSECLRRELRSRLNINVSVLNTGLMAYSPEQYYFTLAAFADRFRPHVVVTSICANDLGNELQVTVAGSGEVEEARYWLEKIASLCVERHWAHLFVAVPPREYVVDRRRPAHFPGQIFNALDEKSSSFLDPLDDFINADLELTPAVSQPANLPARCVLYNDAIPDGHFSALGSKVWAKAVGERIVLMLAREHAHDAQAGLQPRRTRRDGANEGDSRP